ncbi:aryl-sulfate sulfotransferase [Thermodesulfobacteriota bacterium]
MTKMRSWWLVVLVICGLGYVFLGGQSGCGEVCTDDDGDGYAVEGGSCGTIDCDDADSGINPGIDEVGGGLCDDGIDQDCDGQDCTLICTDDDGDGYGDPASPSCDHPEADCDDSDADVNPAVSEDEDAGNCDDGVDNDCDGLVDGADAGCGSGPYDGYTLFNPMMSTTTTLIDNDESSMNTWNCSATPASMPYLMPDCTMVRPAAVSNPDMGGAAAGGRIQKIDWDGSVTWNYIWSNSNHQQHHDIQPMPNGNVLLVSWERKTRTEAIAAGRQSISGEMWPTEIVEIEPSGASGGTVVWEWHLWDHLIQDADPSKPGYGVVADHPELMDINYGNVGGGPQGGGDWLHVNAIDYHAELDQIIFSSRTTNELYIIDHSTTTAEAAGHTGGDSGMGGDFLYRWGNPQVYDRGDSSDRKIYVIHGVNWVPSGYPGAGNILYYENGVGQPGTDYSSVEEVVPPLDGYNYTLAAGQAYGPAAPAWSYNGGGSFYSEAQSGAYRLPNGNTLITVANSNRIMEVSAAGELVWDYTGGTMIARAMKYGDEYFNETCGADLFD